MKREVCLGIAIVLGNLPLSDRVIAQISSDETLPIPTLVPPSVNGKDFLINNGTRSGNNLFHSFSQFSLPTTGSAIFNNATDVQNIFSRVTGSQISNIDGILKTQGGANLFLMNPNGIIFGPNAKLELGGSFVGTTASGIKFSDAIEFNTVNAAPALLSVNLPIGLQMGTNSGTIQANGNGHRFTPLQLFSPFPVSPMNPIANLQVKPGKTLALIGGEIGLQGAVLRSPSGHLELGAVGKGAIVGLLPDVSGWKFDYGQVATFGNVTLGQRALLDSSGNPGGSMHLQGAQIQLRDGSLGLIQNQGLQTPGRLQVNAIDRLELRVDDPTAPISSGFMATSTRNAATTSAIDIVAPRLILENGGSINNYHSGFGIGGSVVVRSTEQIYATGSPSAMFRNTINSITSGLGMAGKVTVLTQDLQLLNQSEILSNTSGFGAGGAIEIEATQIRLGGLVANGVSAYIGSASIGRGNSGHVMINTTTLSIQDSARVESSTYGIGNAGDITVNARESIEVTGTSPLTGKSSHIASSTELPLENFRLFLGLPALPSGNAGVLSIQTPLLKISDGGLVSVVNRGTGNGGRLNLEADRVVLNRGSIQSSTVSGTGGNIRLDVKELLSLRSGSKISAEAGANGDGGNIAIDSPIIVGLENSDIIANAVKGKGGNIKITMESLFGLQYRDRLTPDNDITASSEFGINGNVQVNTIGINPASSLNALPTDITDSSTQIADRCGAAKTSSFIATGRGGMPQGPRKKKASDRPWNDLRPVTATNPATPIAITNTTQPPLVEASAFMFDKSGAIALIAPTPTEIQPAATCAIGQST